MSAAGRHDHARPRRCVALAPHLVLSLAGTVVMAMPAHAQSGPGPTGAPAGDRAAAIERLFGGFVADTVPGAAVLVSRGDSVLFVRGYGLADLEARLPVTPATSFRLASVTKQFTAAAVLALVEQGKLELDARLPDVLPDAPEYAREVRVHHLLAHTSGLPDYEALAGRGGGPQLRDADVLTLLHRATTLHFAPGTRWRYSNSGYALLALIVERATGDTFARFLRARLFDRAGMRSAVAHVEGVDTVAHRAYGHSRAPDGWRRTDQSRTSAVLGDGGVYASVEDLHRWSRALDRHAVIGDALFRQATTPAVLASGERTDYGFGWFLDTHRGHRRQRHEGDTIGFRTALQRYPDDGLLVVVLVNRGAAPVLALADSVANLFLGP